MRTVAIEGLDFHVWPNNRGAIRLRIGQQEFAMSATEALASRLVDSAERHRSYQAAEQEKKPR
ncbi:hypothetical protein [Mycolicibacterium mucogenicum]|uniref:Uncharacterized protein n=1 Tax=Mycolicibacterium mucogenicum TaxID=56689 RepID=A0A4R5WFC3_MYCMU|nr:hypothetical protein [Mycolicibacterium mucogenicum]TDK88664.1 hypothetical protein EUA03_14725 [Mycolicibacterium mucogenicum]